MEETLGKRIARLRKELAEHGAIGNLVTVETSDGDTVRIFVE